MRKRLKKVLKISLFVLGTLVVIDVSLVFGIALSSPKVKKADAIIIMGAAINTPAIYNRTLEGLKLYEAGDAPVLILSGGRISSRYISEAQNMQRILDQNTTHPLKLILDEEAGSTYENIKNAREELPEAESIIIVSDSYHLARSVVMAKSLGFKKVYYSSPDSSYYKPSELLFYFAREMAGMVAYVPKFVWH